MLSVGPDYSFTDLEKKRQDVIVVVMVVAVVVVALVCLYSIDQGGYVALSKLISHQV